MNIYTSVIDNRGGYGPGQLFSVCLRETNDFLKQNKIKKVALKGLPISQHTESVILSMYKKGHKVEAVCELLLYTNKAKESAKYSGGIEYNHDLKIKAQKILDGDFGLSIVKMFGLHDGDTLVCTHKYVSDKMFCLRILMAELFKHNGVFVREG